MIGRQKGQAMIEFALVVPIVIFLFLSILYIGIMFMDYLQYSNAARDAARDISLQTGTAYDAAILRTNLASKINSQNTELLNRYAVQLTNLYSAKWSASFLDSSGNSVNAANASDVQISITLKRDALPGPLENLHILPTELKTINYKMALEKSTIIITDK